MTLHAPGPRRERILLYGLAGAGKSKAWVDVAEWIVRTKAPGKLYVIDTDMAWDAMRPTDGHLDEVVKITPIHTWNDYKPAVQEVRDKASKDDWFVIDLADVVWDAAQEGWSQAVEGEDIDEFFLRHQVNGTSPSGDYGSNWTQIKRMYNGVMGHINRHRGHVIACASAKEVRAKSGQFGDSAETMEKYGKVGWKPAGRDNLPHQFHTEIYLADAPSGYVMTTLKDRQRGKLKGAKVSPDFVASYLIGHAGWKP